MSAADPTKRALMTIGDSSEVLKKPDKSAGTGSEKSKTLRFDLELFEPDEYKFPEFNYKKLVHIEKKKQKKLAKLPNGNHSDPFGANENDDDVQRITRELEAKYGSGTAYGSATSRLPLVNRGAGYDATDSFIDDTEAYDELIPEELEADRGGFYINSGSLEFKKLSNFERPGDEIRMPKAKKRALSTSSESSAAEESAAGQDKNSEKLKKNTHTEKKVKTAAATSSSDEQGKAKKQKKEKLDKQEKIEKPKEVVPKDAPPAKEPEKKKPVEKIPEPEKILKTTTVKDMLRAKRDHMRKMEQGKPTSSGATTATENDDEEDGEIESLSSLAISDSSRDSHPDQPPTNGVKDVQLPSTLPADIISAIGSLKQTAETSKTNFFNTAVLDQLVILDNSVKAISMTSRVQVFNYLEQFVPCTKKTLFAKVRKHRVHQFEIKVKSEVHKLRKVVNDLMPEIKAKYDSELSRYEECKNIQNVIGTDFQLVVPRIKFHWNDEARVALSEITRHLKDRFKCSKKSKETEQDFLVRRMRSDIIPLWPDGWMRLEDLNREVERKKKKDARATAIATQESPQPNLQTKNNTNSATEATNGKSQAQKTEPNTKTSEVEATSKVWTATTQKIPTPSASPSSVIKRSSDHSINSIISASPSPPNTSQSIKTQESASKPRMVDIEKLICPSDLLKTVHQKPSLPRFNFSPIESDKLKAEKVRRSDSSDSDCVEIVGEFSPIKPVKYNQVNHSLPEPFAKKSKKHGSDDGEHETDYSKIIMGLQSLTDPKKYFAQSPSLASPIAQQRKPDSSHAIFDNTS